VSARPPREPIVARSYAPDDAACVQALEVLLKHKGARSDGDEKRRLKAVRSRNDANRG
jgi:hypothetical protein